MADLQNTPPGADNNRDSVLPFGRRKTDHLQDDLIESDGRYYIKGSHYEKLKTHSENLAMVLESARYLIHEKDLKSLLMLIMERVTRVMKADRSSLFLIDDKTDELWSLVAQGTSEIRIPMGKGIAGHVTATGATVNIPNAYEDENFRSEYDLITGYKTSSMLCMPVRNPSGEIIGSIEVLNKLDGTPFHEQDEELLAAFVSLAGTAVDNTRAYEGLHEERDHLSVLVDSTHFLMSEMDLDLLLLKIMEKVTEVMGADRSSLFLVDPYTGELISRVAQGTSEIRIRKGDGIAGHVALTGDTINIRDAYSDQRFSSEFDSISGYRTQSLLCMPVRNPGGEIIGSIEVLNKLIRPTFTEKDELLLGAFSSLAGIALANARSHEELQKERNSLEERVKERTRDLEESQKKSDELLLNILPRSIADELKRKGYATPSRHEEVSVMFTDFVGFSHLSEIMDGESLLKDLDRFFCFFDEMVEQYNLEKIKTIGDSYMCAGGVPDPQKGGSVESVLAAMEIQRFMEEEAKKKREKNETAWGLRVGIHCGPVLAGIVGKKKFAYDIWGDTVNTASRVESAGEVGRVNISQGTYHRIKEFFDCTYRGSILAKNKGEIDMYFVDRIKPELSESGEGVIPNDHFRQLLLKRREERR